MTPHPTPPMARGRKPTLCVFCSASDGIDPRYLDLAAELGRHLVRRGMDLVSGGGSVSMMGALARSVRAEGGHTVGVIPRGMIGWEVADADADELYVTDNMRDRKGLMDAHSDGFLALPGGLGTLEELIEAWTGRTLGMHRKPVVILDPWDDFADLRRLMDKLVGDRMLRPAAAADAVWTLDIPSALDVIERAWAAGEGRLAVPRPDKPTDPAQWLEAD